MTDTNDNEFKKNRYQATRQTLTDHHEKVVFRDFLSNYNVVKLGSNLLSYQSKVHSLRKSINKVTYARMCTNG